VEGDEKVGEVDGIGVVGFLLGTLVGTRDGVFVGSEVGLIDGTFVGSKVGLVLAHSQKYMCHGWVRPSVLFSAQFSSSGSKGMRHFSKLSLYMKYVRPLSSASAPHSSKVPLVVRALPPAHLQNSQ